MPSASAQAKAASGGSDSDQADYGIPSGAETASNRDRGTGPFSDILDVVDSEPADPDDVDHKARRQTRVAPDRRNVESDGFPDPLAECGCGDCADMVDPLADEVSAAFSDVLDRSDYNAVEECGSSRPVTVGRAGTIYYVYQKAAYEREGWTSRLERVRNQHGLAMDTERELLDEWDGEVTTALLSLRLSPIDSSGEPTDVGGCDGDADNYGIPSGTDGRPTEDASPTANAMERSWVEPLRLDGRLNDGWAYVYDRLSAHLEGFDWEYCWVVGATDSAATPHLHVYLWVRDPDDEITVDHLRPAVDSFVRNCQGAYSEDHPVDARQSDAAVVEHDPPRADDVDDEQLLHILHERDDEPFKLNTAGFHYLLNQRPDWALKRILDGESNLDDEWIALEGAAIAWASPNDWIGSSDGFDLTS